ncbi:protein kintoun [Condylostylus longicornis]|uniref:protein kintoun n=1 Tax=Condylostylus longicornis TaxID=2530218 RepID=UPI00244E4589|nr:protein kintoun [Condylostylus longicornis]
MSSSKTKTNCGTSNRDQDGIPKNWEDLDITPQEFDSIRDAFKREDFCKMFSDYCKEMSDPSTRMKYQEEMKQLEAERGVDITFLNPTPHFVIKTSSNGKIKCFINIASNDQIDKPSNEVRLNEETGKKEIFWRLPYAQAEPRPDFDNKKNRCVVHDVIFHPDAIHLAERNSMLRRHLVNTACDAVEREFKVQLDRTNLKFPKLKYKGVPKVTVKRRLMDQNSKEYESSPLDEHMPPMPEVRKGQEIPKVYKSKDVEPDQYTTPKYLLKHRRDVDMSEMTYELDAKLNITIPKELVIEIELPLLKTTADCNLDVTERKLYFNSEKPAKYRLNIDLPYPVKDQLGSAKFDKSTKKLVVTLPVHSEAERCIKDLYREDSGVESDPREENSSLDSPTRKDSPTPEDFGKNKSVPLVEELINSEDNLDEGFTRSESITQEQTNDDFLRTDVTYNPVTNFDCNALDNNLVFVLQVKNVDPQTVEFQKSENYVNLKFISLGAGYYPVYYSFYLKLSNEGSDHEIESVDAEAWDNNVILTLTLNNLDGLSEYSAGLNEHDLKQYNTPGNFNSYNKLANSSNLKRDGLEIKANEIENHKFDIEVKHCNDSNQIELEIKPKTESNENIDLVNDEKFVDVEQAKQRNAKKTAPSNNNQNNKNKKKKNKKRRSYSESACDELKANNDDIKLISSSLISKSEKTTDNDAEEASDDGENDENMDERNISIVGGRKQRSFSESRSISDCTPTFKGILKHYSRYGRSISESCSSIDDQYSCSTENLQPCESFSVISEEGIEDDAGALESGHSLSESCKKTVRFSEVIHKQLFRMDSSILGQRKKNQKKKNQKLRALKRRNSEGDTADYDDKARSLLLEKKGLKSLNNNGNLKSDQQNNHKNRTESESSDIESKNSMIFDLEI